MSAPPSSDRQVIPRWRSYEATVSTGELAPLQVGVERPWVRNTSGRDQLEFDFGQRPERAVASDLVGSALLLGRTATSIEAAQLLLDEAEPSSLAAQAAGRLLDKKTSAAQGDAEALGRQRRRLRLDPRDAVRWADLARLHTIAGQDKEALRAISVALSLAPADRYVLRSASRLSVHQGDFERAHLVLSNAASTPGDPWLLAAEIAAAAVSDRRSRFLRVARRVVASGTFSSFATSELASALATLEVKAGGDRSARKLFRVALEEPSDNSIAQAQWARGHLGHFEIDERHLQARTSWEARAYSASRAGSWEHAVAESWDWHYDQPFASRPAQFGSYQASLGQNYEAGVKLARAGLRANPDEFLLNNNLAFCLASAGHVVAAERALGRISEQSLSRHDRATYLATRGLVHYRRGRLIEGRRSYESSISLGTDRFSRNLARVMLAREELLAHLPGAGQILETVEGGGSSAGEGEDLGKWLSQVLVLRQRFEEAALRERRDQRS